MQTKETCDFEKITYLKGFGNSFLTEAVPGTVPTNQNSPLELQNGVYAQQLSGTAFTVKRSQNQKVWYYKVRPSVVEGQFEKSKFPFKIVSNYLSQQSIKITPNQLRWKKIPSQKQEEKVNFIQGMTALMGAGEPSLKQGTAIYAYSANCSMGNSCFYNSDGDFLIVPFQGVLKVKTLNGLLTVKPKQILVIPRGIKFSIDIDSQAKGWVSEIFGHHFTLPELGPIGANGLANPGDFEYPTAWFSDKKEKWTIYNKFIGQMFECQSQYCPFDVVGWKGNYSAYKYNLELFNTIGSISFDHPDPSIFTVLTTRSAMEGTAVIDFVIFPTRWLVQQHTFKPPYYHRNCMTQFMGSISGEYDAKGKGFEPGCSSLHSCMTPHGPDSESTSKAVQKPDQPQKIPEQSLAFMFQSGYLLKTTKYAFDGFLEVDEQYSKIWKPLGESKFNL